MIRGDAGDSIRLDAEINLRQLGFVRIANYTINPRKRRDFFGCTLSVASSNDDLAVRIFATDPAYGRPRILIRRSSNGAGVQYNNFGLCCERTPASDHDSRIDAR